MFQSFVYQRVEEVKDERVRKMDGCSDLASVESKNGWMSILASARN